MPTRLDKLIAIKNPEISRTRARELIEAGRVAVSGIGVISNPSHNVADDSEIILDIPPATELSIEPYDYKLDIIFEDSDIVVINKPVGMATHPAVGNYDKTLVNALLYHCGDSLSGIGGVMRPGIVHRLDKDTSGLIVVAKNDAAHQSLSAQIESRTMKRTYHALVYGRPKNISDSISTLIGRNPKDRKKMAVVTSNGKLAITNYKVIKSYYNSSISLVECRLDTGRTHQIRVHMSHIGNALIGDQVYGRKNKKSLSAIPEPLASEIWNFPRQCLHAVRLELIHPKTCQQMTFQSEIADDIAEVVEKLL